MDHNPYKGGHGSGLDAASVNLAQFTLSPGKAGRNKDTYGGGGGGIIVDGEKLERNEFQGEGFGGGGGGYGGLPGCVLLEVEDGIIYIIYLQCDM